MIKSLITILVFTVAVLADTNSTVETKSTFVSGVNNSDTCKIECPPLKDGLFGRIADVELRTGTTKCYIYNIGEPNKLLGTAVNTNDKCVDYFDYQLSKNDFASLGIKDNATTAKGALVFKQYSDLKSISEKYFNHYGDTGTKHYVDMPKMMIASLTVDSEIINIKDTVRYNELTLNPQFTIYPNAQTNAEQSWKDQYEKDHTWISVQINNIKNWFGSGVHYDEQLSNGANPNIDSSGVSVNDKVNKTVFNSDTKITSSVQAYIAGATTFMIDFLSRFNNVILSAKSYLFILIVPFSILFAVSNKLTKLISKVPDHDDIVERVTMALSIIFFFYLTTTTVEIDQEKKISQTNFQNWIRPVFYKGSDLADTAAEYAAEAYLNTKLRGVGLAPKEMLSDTYRELERTKKENAVLTSIKGECYGSYNTAKMRELIGSRLGLNQTFPQTENLIVENNIIGKTNLNFYTTGEYGFLRKSEYQTMNNLISASACYKNERELQLNNEKIAKLENLLAMNKNATKDDVLSKQVDMIANLTYRNTAELGWISTAGLAMTSVMVDNLGVFNTDVTRSDKQEQVLKDYRSSGGVEIGGIAEGEGPMDFSINWLMSNLPYTLLPGADSLTNRFQNMLDSIGIPGLNTIKNIFKKEARSVNKNHISFVKQKEESSFFNTLITKVSKLNPGSVVMDALTPIIATVLTILVFKYLLLYLPIFAISLASGWVIGLYLLSLQIFYLVAPFLIVFAFSTGQPEAIKGFIKKGIILAFKPLLIVVSIVVALLAVELFQTLNFILVNWQIEPLFMLTELPTNHSQTIATTVAATMGVIDLGLVFLKGALIMINAVVGSLVVGYLVLNGAELILDIGGFRDGYADSQIIAQNIEHKTQRYQPV